MRAENIELRKAMEALQGIEAWGRDVEQLEMVGGTRLAARCVAAMPGLRWPSLPRTHKFPASALLQFQHEDGSCTAFFLPLPACFIPPLHAPAVVKRYREVDRAGMQYWVLNPCPCQRVSIVRFATLDAPALPATMQVRVWSVVEGYATAAARIQAALDDDMPYHLAEARDQLEEARREHDALQQAVEGKVGWGWRGSAVEGSGQRVQQRGQQMHKPGIDTWSFAWARVPENPSSCGPMPCRLSSLPHTTSAPHSCWQRRKSSRQGTALRTRRCGRQRPRWGAFVRR